MITELRRNINDIGNQVENHLGEMILQGKCFYRKVVQKTPYPYMMFFFVTIPSSRDTGTVYEDAYLQLNIYDKFENMSVLEWLKEEFKKNIVKEAFSLTSHKIIAIIHQFDRDIIIEDSIQLISQYKIQLEKT